jgi:hypothetical protein
MLRAIPDEILRQDPVIIINENKGTALDVRGRKYRRISDFQGAIVRDENYFIYDTAFAATPPGARGEK